jgi:hypothetical protein
MIYIWHAIGILFIINAVTAVLSGDQIGELGQKMFPTSLVVSAVYVISLFFIYG